MTKLYRVVAYALDLNGNAKTKEEVKRQIENNKWPEFLNVKEISETDIGELYDDHELNKLNAPYEKYFPECSLNQNNEVTNNELIKARTSINELEDRVASLQRHIELTRRENESLQKIKDFVKLIKDLTK